MRLYSLVASSTLAGALIAGARGRPAAPVPFAVSSLGADYPFAIRLEGTFEERGDSLLIDVARGVIVDQVPTEYGAAGAATDVGLAFGLGADSDGTWLFGHETKPQPVAPSLQTQDTVVVKPSHFVITGLDTVPLGDRWLAAQVWVHQHLPNIPAGPLTSYACTETNLRGPTKQSRIRAARMAKHYADVC